MVLVQCVLFISLLPSIPNLQHNLQNVHFWDMPITKRDFVAMIIKFVAFVFLSVVFLINIFFQQFIDPSDSPFVTLPGFSDKTPFVKFNPNSVYHSRGDKQATGSTPPDPPPPSGPSGVAPLRRSTHISVPPNRYGFTHTSLMATMTSTTIPNLYSQAVQHKCWNTAMQED